MPKNNSRRKPAQRSIKPKSQFRTNLLRALSGIALLTVLVVLSGVLAKHLFLRGEQHRLTSIPDALLEDHLDAEIPEFEVFSRLGEEAPEHDVICHPVPKQPKPEIAIIIDDLGYDSAMASKFLTLDKHITLAILPHSPLQRKIATQAHQKGIEIMLHLPMEPLEYPMVKPGPGALLSTMTTDQMVRQLEDDIDAVPFISGVNNHMGSKITAISTRMYQIFTILKKKGLYFVDSRTTKDTLCRPSSRLLRIKFAERDVFLDNIRDPEAIRKQIDRLIRKACKAGTAVGIAHPYKVTHAILQAELPEILKKARLVPVSEVVEFTG